MAARLEHRRVLGGKIRACREKAGFSIEKLAEKAGLHHNFVGDVERGIETISVDNLARIAKALNVRLRDLFEDL